MHVLESLALGAEALALDRLSARGRNVGYRRAMLETDRKYWDCCPRWIGREYGAGIGRAWHTGQVGATTTCSQNKHVGEFLYFKLPKLPVQVKSRAIKDVTKYVLNTDVQFTN